MTDRFNALVVVLDKDMRDDDAQALTNAIQQLRGVTSVSGNVSDINSLIACERAKRELGEKVWAVIYPPKV
jgi:inosine-uridine nucleoside N-ribohydrolase